MKNELTYRLVPAGKINESHVTFTPLVWALICTELTNKSFTLVRALNKIKECHVACLHATLRQSSVKVMSEDTLHGIN